ncbi:hypothetical protein ACERNI_06530 [Camelimonas sp. ID_303_24]
MTTKPNAANPLTNGPHGPSATADTYDVAAAITQDGAYCAGEELLARGEITPEQFSKLLTTAIQRKLARWRMELAASGVTVH